MSDLPDEIVERVAKAIFDGIIMQDGVELVRDLDEEGKHWLKVMARAALTASGWAEMKEALEWYANPEVYKPHPHGLAFDRGDLSFKATDALRKARGET